MIGFKLLVAVCVLGVALAQQDYQQEYRPAPLRIGTNAAEPKPTPIPILKQINSYRNSRKRCFIMAGNNCRFHSGNNTRSNYQPEGSQDHDGGGEEQYQETRKQQQQPQAVGDSENVGKGFSADGSVGGRKIYVKVQG